MRGQIWGIAPSHLFGHLPLLAVHARVQLRRNVSKRDHGDLVSSGGVCAVCLLPLAGWLAGLVCMVVVGVVIAGSLVVSSCCLQWQFAGNQVNQTPYYLNSGLLPLLSVMNQVIVWLPFFRSVIPSCR